MSNWRLIHVSELALAFGFGQTAEHPKDGLFLFGPPASNQNPARMDVGVIGTQQGIARYEHWVRTLGSVIAAPEKGKEENKMMWPGFQAIFGVPWPAAPFATCVIDGKELSRRIRIENRHEAIFEAVKVYAEALRKFLREEDARPKLWFAIVPEETFRFGRPKSSIRLLDLTALVDLITPGSFFDPQYKDRLGRAKFLRSLSQRLTAPVMPDDEFFDYLIAQAVADFLATDSRMAIDGILFPSVQVAGPASNVVLFHKGSAVQRIELPLGTKVRANAGFTTEDGWEYDFTVWEEAPEPESAQKTVSLGFEHIADLPDLSHWHSDYTPARPDTLEVDLTSVRAHEIKAVAFTTDDYPVTRHRSRLRTSKVGKIGGEKVD